MIGQTAYLSSLDVPCEEMLRIVREHWKTEGMHWMLDVVFAEDECRILSASGQKAMNVFRKLALSLHKNHIQIVEKYRHVFFRGLPDIFHCH